jgi:hypothetical protein
MNKVIFIIGIILLGVGIIVAISPDPLGSYSPIFFVFGAVAFVMGLVSKPGKISFKPVREWKK